VTSLASINFWGCLLKVDLPTFRRVLTKEQPGARARLQAVAGPRAVARSQNDAEPQDDVEADGEGKDPLLLLDRVTNRRT
jgi:hypothetical protein